MLNDSQSQSKTLSRLTLWDRLGITLSALCLVHCVVTPLLLLSLPWMTQTVLRSPMFHFGLALLIVPIGLFAFTRGYRHHRQKIVLLFGIPGLVLVALVPILLDYLDRHGPEPLVVSIGSLFLVFAHWKNQRACACENHHH